MKIVVKIKVKKGVVLKRKMVCKMVSEFKDGVEDMKGIEDLEYIKGLEVFENDESVEVEGNEWCVYFILLNDKWRMYMGVIVNIIRRFIFCFMNLKGNMIF